MADKYYDSPLTGEELDAAMRVLPTMPTLAETAQKAAAAAEESEQTAADHESRAQAAAEAAAESARQAAESAATVDMSGYLQKEEAAETYAPIEAGVATYTHSRSGSVHNLAGQGANGRVQLTADVQAGDTWAVNGEPVKAYMGAADATETMAGESYSGKWLSFIYADGAINFKGGGGGSVTVSGLSADTIKAGATVTVKQGAKTVQSVSGTYTKDATASAADLLIGKTAYANGNKITGILPDTNDANAVSGDILSGKTAYVNRNKVTGTMPDRNTVGINGAIGINATYYNVALNPSESNLQCSDALDGNGYIAVQAPNGYFSGNAYIGILRSLAFLKIFQNGHITGGRTSISVVSGKTYFVFSSWNSGNFNQTMLNSGVNGGNILAWWSSTGVQSGVTGYWVQMAVVLATSGTLSFESSGNGLYYMQLD